MTPQIARRSIGALRVAAVEIPGLRSVASVLALRAGQWFEPPGRPGIARLAAQTLLRGTRSRDAATWSSALDALGATARIDVGGHAAFFSGQCLADDLGAYLALVSESVLRPAFPDAELELVRAQTLAAFEEDSRDTRAVADSAWRELAYPSGHPFHTRPLGDEQVVRAATADELRAFHQAAIVGAGANLVIAGGIGAQRALDAVAAAFAEWSSGQARVAAWDTPALSAAKRRDTVVEDKTQSDVVLGWHAMSRRDPRFTAARVTNMVFAADTFASRAGNVVRDQLGLAYYVFSTIGTSLGAAPWTVRMGVNPENVERAVETTFVELRKILAGEIADDDLALSRDKLVGELDVALESPGGVAQLLLEGELYDLGEDFNERYPRELRAVTKEQVVEIARTFLPVDRYVLSVAGPPLTR